MPKGVYDRLPYMRSHQQEKRNQAVLDLRRRRYKLQQIADKLGITKSMVSGILYRDRNQKAKMISKVP